ASRGIGLEIVRQLLESPDNLVVAACRTPDKATALSALKDTVKGTLHIVQLDTSDFDSVRALPAQLEPILGSTGLDYLINNAGIVCPLSSPPIFPHSPHDHATALADVKKSARGTLYIVQLDASDFDSIRALPNQLAPILESTGLDYLISNAGIWIDDTAFTLDPDALLTLVRTNVAGPALLAQVVLPLLAAAPTKKVLHVSSTGGSIGSVAQIPREFALLASYPISKAALNMLVCKQKVEWPDLTVIALCPGWVQTDMGGKGAVLTPEESVAGIIKVITTATKEDSGKFLRYHGASVLW
ncbi:hypothetical protein TRAPUB_9068, partial [Trametes pubescens]